MRHCLPGSLLSAGTPFGCVICFLRSCLKSVNQLLEVRVIPLFNPEVLQFRGLIFAVHWSVAILLTIAASMILSILRLLTIIPVLGSSSSVVYPSRSNSFSNGNLSYCFDYIYTPSLHFRWPLGASCGACVSPRLFPSSRILPFLRFRLFSLIHGRWFGRD